jgi:hypothetical protein
LIVARPHDLSANMLFTWGRETNTATASAIDGSVTFAPAAITAEPASMPSLASPATGAASRIEIVLANGDPVIDAAAPALVKVCRGDDPGSERGAGVAGGRPPTCVGESMGCRRREEAIKRDPMLRICTSSEVVHLPE